MVQPVGHARLILKFEAATAELATGVTASPQSLRPYSKARGSVFVMSAFGVWPQVVDATQALNFSAGVLNPKV